MPLFDDPVEATLREEPVLWLGCESAGDLVMAVVVGAGGSVSLVDPGKLNASFRHVEGRWRNAGDEEQPAPEAAAPPPTAAPKYPYPPDTIFDSEGNPYTKDGDPL